MRALLRELGEPQERFPAIHVVGTNGKSTTTRLTEALLLDAGLSVGAYLSPHVRGWSERIRVGGEEADFEAAVAAVRPAAGVARRDAVRGAHGRGAARVRGGGGRRRRRRGRARRPARRDERPRHPRRRPHERRARPHGRARRHARGDRRREARGRAAGLHRRPRASPSGASSPRRTARPPSSSPRAATSRSPSRRPSRSSAGSVDPHAADGVALPGTPRAPRRAIRSRSGTEPTTSPASAGCCRGSPRRRAGGWTVVCSILARQAARDDARGAVGARLDARRHGEPQRPRAPGRRARRARLRPLRAGRGRARARAAARARALELAGADGAVLVTGSLYLLAELSGDASRPITPARSSRCSRSPRVVLAAVIGSAFAAGWVIGRMLL